MIPDSVRSGTASRAEKRLFNRLRSELPDDCYVLHSLGLTNHEKMIWGECDYVVLSPGGIFVLEVKGGGVSCENGEWLFTNSSGKVFKKYEGPFEQAKEAMFAVRRFVEKRDDLKGLLYGYGVIMPDEKFIHESPEIELGVLLDRRNFHNKLDGYMRTLGDFWREYYAGKHDVPPRLPAKNEIAAVRQVLRPEIRTVYTLNSSLEKTEQDQIELTDRQRRVIRCIDANPRTIVRGGAGTGKTVLALDKAVRLAGGGGRVLYICYNRLLGLSANSHAAVNTGHGSLEAWSIHAWFDRVIDEARQRDALGAADGDMEEYYSHRYPNVYMDSLLKLEMKLFDAVVVDEAQDLLKDPYLDAIDLSLEGGLGEGRWHFFMDEEQDIFHAVENSALKRLNEYSHARIDLTANCRNTRGIIRAVSRISGIPMNDEEAVDGPEPKIVHYRDGADEVSKVSRVVDELFADGIPAKDIIILSGHRLEKSSFAGVEKISGHRLRDITHDSGEYMKSLDFCTIQAFKGLERRVVIAVDLLALDTPVGRMLHYCGFSRARTMLVVMLGEGEESG